MAALPLEPLFDLSEAPKFDLPAELTQLYGGGLGFESPRLYANFVSSIDGVVALGAERNSGSWISGRNPADRFVMGLTRACADVVVVGAGTMRAEGKGALWTPGYVYPAAADAFQELRRRLKRSSQPQLAILTAGGDLDPTLRALETGALILTTNAGAAVLRPGLPPASRVLVIGRGRGFSISDAVAALRKEGYRMILSEGGPTVVAALLGAGLLDELFLTLSPVIAGRQDGSLRRGLTHGYEFAPSSLQRARLLSLRRSESHLFLRYGITHGN